MKKSYFIFILLFFIVIGYASVNAVLDIKSNIKVAENIEDFKIEITNLSINNNDSKNLISKDKHSFTFTGTSNDNINYTVTNYSYQYDANITLTCTPSENITIEQINTLSAQDRITKTITSKRSDEVTCTINIEKISRTKYAEDICKYQEGQVWTFNYTGSEQTFTVPCDGEYKIELWGAQGGNNAYGGVGGKGAYTSGNINFQLNQKIYFYVGGKGQSATSTIFGKSLISGGFNGGGSNGAQDNRSPGGGGATDVRLINGSWNNSSGLRSRIMVAGAGGGGGISNAGAYGNMTAGKWNSLYGGNGTQTSGGAVGTGYTHNSGATAGGFGYGGNGGLYVVGAGGSGYYGGAGGQHITTSTSGGGGGGSSFISGHTGCNAMNEAGVHTGQPNHYSGNVFTNTAMIAGNTSMPSHDGASTVTGNSGNGYAKITYLGY